MSHSALKHWRSASAPNRPLAPPGTRMKTILTRRLAMVTAMLWFEFGGGGQCEAGLILSTPAGLSPGDTFRFVFLTDGHTDALSSNIADYNSFVNTQAGGATYNGSTVSWAAIGSTSSVNAIDNVGQTMTSVYLADGRLVATSTTSALFGLWSGGLLSPINQDLVGTTPPPSDYFAWTGTNTDGTGTPGRTLGAPGLYVEWGTSSWASSQWVSWSIATSTDTFRMYGVSQVLTASSAVPEPSTLLMAGTALVFVIAFERSRKRRQLI
jgi:hypothetical protein